MRTGASLSTLAWTLAAMAALSSCKLRLLGTGPSGNGALHSAGPTAQLLGVPAVTSADATLNVTVVGTEITHYRYAVGSSSLDCSVEPGYSAEIPVSTSITDTIGSNGGQKICVVGKSLKGVWQDFAGATIHTWSKYMVVAVQKVYPGNSSWNEYVKDDDRTQDQYSQTDDACAYTETGPYTCIHGGEMRKVVLTGHASCLGLLITEALGAFDWECKVRAGTATFLTRGLKSSKGLKDLLNATSWKDNSISVHEGSNLIARSEPAVWDWLNPVRQLPDNSASSPILLNGTDDDGAGPDEVYAAGTLFTLSSSRVSAGYELGLNRMGIVTLPGSALSFCGTDSNNCGLTEDCLVYAGHAATAHQLWIEGNFDGDHPALRATHVIRPWSSNLTTVKSSTIKNALGLAMYFRWGLLGRVRDVTVSGAGPFNGGSWNTLENLSVYNGTDRIVPGANSYVYNCRVANSSGAIYTDTGTTVQKCIASNGEMVDATYVAGLNTTFVNYIVHNGNRHGVTFRSGGESRSTMTHFVSASNNNGFPFNIRQDGDFVTLVSGAVLNEGIFLDGSGNKLANIAFSDTLTTFPTTVDNSFHQNLLFLSGAQCSIDPLGTNPGLVNGTCAPQGASTHAAHSGITTTASMKLEISANDSANASDSSGTATYNASTLDWLSFESFWRGWGIDGAIGFPDNSNIGKCDGTNTSCVIWDWSLKGGDAVLRNRTGTGINANENQPFVAGSTCPSVVHGNRSIQDNHQRDWYPAINAIEIAGDAIGNDDGVCESGEKCRNEFLVSAVEIRGDRIGDEDGLCEDNESCIYSPNFGAYQGEGDYLAGGTCTFQDGAVAGVAMYAYPVN